MEAVRVLGQMMAEQKKIDGFSVGTRGSPIKGARVDEKPTLAEQGIDKNLAHRARALAKMPDADFRAAVEVTREGGQKPPKPVDEGKPAPKAPARHRKPLRRRKPVPVATVIDNIIFAIRNTLFGMVDLRERGASAADFDRLFAGADAVVAEARDEAYGTEITEDGDGEADPDDGGGANSDDAEAPDTDTLDSADSRKAYYAATESDLTLPPDGSIPPFLLVRPKEAS
jgi:hypothetical protein